MAHQAKHISSNFDVALYALKNDVLKMSSLTDRMFQSAVDGLFNRNSQFCDYVVAEDDEVDILEKQVDQDEVKRVDSLSASRVGYERGCFRDEDQHKFGAHCRPIHCYRAKSEDATNIAEDSFWRDEAVDIRHTFGTPSQA